MGFGYYKVSFGEISRGTYGTLLQIIFLHQKHTKLFQQIFLNKLLVRFEMVVKVDDGLNAGVRLFLHIITNFSIFSS